MDFWDLHQRCKPREGKVYPSVLGFNSDQTKRFYHPDDYAALVREHGVDVSVSRKEVLTRFEGKDDKGPFFYILFAFAQANQKGVTISDTDCHYYCVCTDYTTDGTREIMIFEPRVQGDSDLNWWPLVIKNLLGNRKKTKKYVIYGTQKNEEDCGQHVVNFINTWHAKKDSYVKVPLHYFK